MMRLSEFKDLIANMPVSYQAVTSKKETWRSHIQEDNEAGKALRSIFENSDDVTVTLSRNDLRSLASKANLAQFVMATIIWGYPSSMRGNHVAKLTKNTKNFETLTRLLSTARTQPVTDWCAHYKAVEEIAGIGLSTYTKFLNFLSVKVHGNSALILDDRIIRVASQRVFKELEPIRHLSRNNAERSYPEYLSCIDNLAKKLAVSTEKIEFFLFEFGLNLKPLPTQQIAPVGAPQAALP
jgi:hypothetical protein